MQIAPETWAMLQIAAITLVLGFILGALSMEIVRRIQDARQAQRLAAALKKARLFLWL
jgi:uncharacterized membrane-anchored protein YhcB (DUF1043 family)